MVDTKISTLTQYLHFIESNCVSSDYVLFRGQSQDWTLLPKLARVKFHPGVLVKEAEKKMFCVFKSRALPFLDRNPSTDWDWLSIAQHHGMATRLLDWSTNPLVALWFAIERPAIDRKNGVVWVFTPEEDNHVNDETKSSPFLCKSTKVYRARHNSRRIIAQHGWFTVHFIRDTDGHFVPLESNKKYKNCLTKLVIPGAAFSNLRFELDRCGINAATLYSDLEGVCRNTEWDFTLYADEND